MDQTILSTKLNPPPKRDELVSRPRLFELMDAGLQCKLTLISAPAGFGKTTLVGEWVHRLGEDVRVAWFSLDEADNDVTRFLAYLQEALYITNPELGRTSTDLPQPLMVNARSTLDSTLNRIARWLDPIVVVLDDYHLVEAQPVHDALQYFLAHQPSHLHLVIATRADPPLRLSRLRGQGQLNELRLTDLRFSREETNLFLQRMTGKQLSNAQVAAMTNRTEGWIAGLQMAAISMRNRDDPGGFVQSFTGSNRFILDYLTEEVLQRQPREVHDFLLKTSILERLNGPLCDFVLESHVISNKGGFEYLRTTQDLVSDGLFRSATTSSTILEYLERSNLFLIPLDDRREWYRYHQLFADLLQARLAQTQPEHIPGLHQRASQWLEQNGLLPEAIEHAFAAGDFERATRLIDRIAEATLMRSEVATLSRWLEMLPEERIRACPNLVIFHAWTLFLNGRSLEEIQARIEILSALPGNLSVKALPLNAFLAIFRGDAYQAMELSRQSLESLEEEDAYLRNVAYFVQSLALLSESSSAEGLSAMEQTIRKCMASGNSLVGVMAMCSLAENYKKLGMLHKSYDLYQEALDIAVDSEGKRLPIAGRALIGVSDFLWEWNELDRSRQMVEEGIEIVERTGQVGSFQGYLQLVRIRQSQGDAEGAREALGKARELAFASHFTVLDDLMADLVEAQLAIAQGDLRTVSQWVKDRGLSEEEAPSVSDTTEVYIQDHFRKYEKVIQARLWLAQNRPQQALQLLDTIEPLFEKMNRPTMIIRIVLMKALALQTLGKEENALTMLNKALRLAEPEGYMRTFLDEGEEASGLLVKLRDRKTTVRDYLEDLLAAFGVTSGKHFPVKSSTVQEEPLSDREREVLRLLDTSLSSSEIAEELVVSVNTARSHIKRIYLKLNVHSRYQAVVRARELGYI